MSRAHEAAARYLFPLGETGLAKRLPRLRSPVLLLRGECDRAIPAGQLARLASCMSVRVQTATIENAGHLADLDEPIATSQRIPRVPERVNRSTHWPSDSPAAARRCHAVPYSALREYGAPSDIGDCHT